MPRAVDFPESNKTLLPPPGTEKDVYPLPVHQTFPPNHVEVISCWQFTTDEIRQLIANGGRVWFRTYGTTHPPIALETTSPFSGD